HPVEWNLKPPRRMEPRNPTLDSRLTTPVTGLPLSSLPRKTFDSRPPTPDSPPAYLPEADKS
ncbi:MAG: hypothetical protein NC212_02090, partial [Staphylococcus sp.]|nr:hypothetical protein [Staphylococcus sp.]